MNRKSVPELPHMPVALPVTLPQFGNPFLLVQAMQATQPKSRPLVPQVGSSPKHLVTINSELCKGCELCVYACPMGNLSLSPDLNRKGYHPVVFDYNGTRGPCSACGLCYWVCPDFSIIEVKKLKQ